MNLFPKWPLLVLALGALLALALLGGARLGWLRGTAPTDLGVHAGRLKAPSPTPNSVSSQAALHPSHPQHAAAQIAPLRYSGDGPAAMKRLAQVVAGQPQMRIVTCDDTYLRVEASTRWLRFTDDIEFWLDEANGVIQLRSASRIGRRDFGANRQRIEALRRAFDGTVKDRAA